MLVLDDGFEFDFSLMAIHCSLEDYRMAFMINKCMGLRLARTKKDLTFEGYGFDVGFSRYLFEDEKKYITYNLIGNKCKARINQQVAGSGLFADVEQSTVKTINLVPEHKSADYLLMYDAHMKGSSINLFLNQLKEIPQIITVYEVEVEGLKSKTNLIFE
tara:strand:+ start:619 stop:1098 length:480 start_codon:yes stop_codon:yes gene_type:complete